MGVFMCLVCLLVFSFPTCLHANRLKLLQNKIYAVERSLLQDIQILRATVEINTGEMQTFGKLINATLSRLADIDLPLSNDEVLKQGDITESRKAVEEKRVEYTSDEIKRIVDDIERVKRTFHDEKIYLRTLENVLIDKLDTIIQNQNKQTIEKLDTIIQNQNKQTIEKLDTIIQNQNKLTIDKLDTIIQNQNKLTIDKLITIIQNQNKQTIDKLDTIIQNQSKQNDNNAHFHKSLINIDKETTELTALLNRNLGEIMHEASSAHTAISSNITSAVSKSESSILEFSKLGITQDEVRDMTDDLRDKMLRRFCTQYVEEVGSVRLVNTTGLCGGIGGRLEVKYNGKWGTVCDDLFDINNNGAIVVCKMLGFSSGKPKNLAYFGQGTGLDILLDDVSCIGTETNIFDCPFIEHIGNCGHHEDVGVVCSY